MGLGCRKAVNTKRHDKGTLNMRMVVGLLVLSAHKRPASNTKPKTTRIERDICCLLKTISTTDVSKAH
jgi:hypothetical protein